MTRALWIGCLLLCAAADGSAQQRTGSVTGVVRDESGQPLPGAQVFVRSARREVQTDGRGGFSISLAAGRHQIQVSLVGYKTERREVTVEPGVPTSVAVSLPISPLSLPGVQVTATIGADDALSVTQATTQLSGKQLERELSSTIAQTLRSQPGISVRFMGPAAAMPVMRGLTGDRILVLQDGLRTADLSGSADDHGVTIDPLSAQRIEVVRGPATLLYGNNALGGVVNVISSTIPGHVPQSAEWVVGLHSESAYPGGAVSAKGTFSIASRLSSTFSFGARSSQDMRIPNDPQLGARLLNSDMRNWSASGALGYVTENAGAGLAVKAYDFSYGLPVPPGASAVSLRGRRYELTGRSELRFNESTLSSLRFDASAQDYEHDELDDASRDVLQSFALKTQTFNVLLRHKRVAGVAEGAIGVSGLFKDYAAVGTYALTPAAVSRGIGVFAFEEVPLVAGGAALQVGARFDHYGIESRTSEKFGPARDRTFPAFSGSVGMRVPIATTASASLSATRSFRAPTVEELFSNAAHAGTGAVELGNPELKSERGVALEGVLRVQSGRFNGQVALYRNTIDDYVFLQAQGDTLIGNAVLPILSYSQARARLQGAEGSLEWAVSQSLVASVMGDYLHAEQEDGTPLSFMPPARLGMTVRWDNGRYSLGGDIHHEYRQDRVGAASELPTPAHTILRLHSGVRFRALKRQHSVTLRAENIANELHREATSRIKDFAPGPGRNFAISYRVLF